MCFLLWSAGLRARLRRFEPVIVSLHPLGCQRPRQLGGGKAFLPGGTKRSPPLEPGEDGVPVAHRTPDPTARYLVTLMTTRSLNDCMPSLSVTISSKTYVSGLPLMFGAVKVGLAVFAPLRTTLWPENCVHL